MDIAINIHGVETITAGSEGLTLDLVSMGIGKLLGRGSINVPFNVKVSEYSSRALEKLEAVGGQIIEAE